MNFDSPDVEKEFPGLYEDASTKGKKDDANESEHEKLSKKELLIGRRKEKKDKKCYATLGDDDEEEPLAGEASSSKSKKLKGFKFSKSKDKDSGKNTLEKKEKKEKEKNKEKKDKDKKKDEKKLKSKEVSEEVQELGEAQPIFGVPLSVAVERSRCHDGVELPLVVRDCIDFLQEHLQNEHIHRSDGSKTRLQQLKKLYNNRESNGIQDFDVATASALLKMFLKELPEPVLTTDLLPRFEEAAALATSTEQEKELKILVEQQLPICNRILVSWIFLHFDAIIAHEKHNKFNPQNLAVVLSPVLQMSHRLFVTLLCYCTDLFADVTLTKYTPPVTSTSPNLPETRDEIIKELKKQESLLNQIHAEMHAGFVTKKREEQLWEVQRIITQLKRKLRTFDKKTDSMQKSIEDSLEPPAVTSDTASMELSLHKVRSCSDDESSIRTQSNTNTESKPSPQEPLVEDPSEMLESEITTDENGFMMVPVTHPDYLTLIRLQLENQELINWKEQLQQRITAERSEIVKLKKILSEIPVIAESHPVVLNPQDEADYERLTAHYLRENGLLQEKRNLLAKDLFDENRALINLQVELALQKFKI
ncbi:ralA-binding protein 1 [Culicoides brevitarsis]|uniref:ralA-binding protein 1 n=1 Tax=Culicoides brevitarsis TaxID=469753 RepID=UPI00307BBCDF